MTLWQTNRKLQARRKPRIHIVHVYCLSTVVFSEPSDCKEHSLSMKGDNVIPLSQRSKMRIFDVIHPFLLILPMADWTESLVNLPQDLSL